MCVCVCVCVIVSIFYCVFLPVVFVNICVLFGVDKGQVVAYENRLLL